MAEVTPAQLRALPSLTGSGPAIDLAHLPDDPVELFCGWLDHAVRAGVPEPHAMTLSTVDDAGLPDARTLILTGVDSRGWRLEPQQVEFWQASADRWHVRTTYARAATGWQPPVTCGGS